ncbi:MAG: KEOPS complex N(6)-L-threonylcarbamoyladenine synthase Kae1 [Candidatus Micrarchaeota archaeon]|nr:KEOPS complex N(6)-L-threonylcarbamoyladenine synthase Kae1 [Candidatus Micrarchaeota archaeon]
MKVLGIECTAHTLGIGIVENGKVLSNIHDVYKPKNEGIIPRKAADHHAEVFASVLKANLDAAKLSMNDIDLIAFSQGPGIGAPLSVGIAGAKYLAAKFNKKMIGINHPYAHVEISKHLTDLKNPLVLYLSGGNSQILVEEKQGYHVLGETLDIGIGNLFDTFGRAIGLEYAHGSVLEQLAKQGKYVELPYTVKGMNLVFSGLLTQAEKLFKEGKKREDLTYSIMETAFAMSCEATERALFLTRKKELIICGGVAQNKRLQEMLKSMCKEDNVKFGVAPDEFNRDNGAMIAYAGSVLYKKYGAMKLDSCKPITNYRIDTVDYIARG